MAFLENLLKVGGKQGKISSGLDKFADAGIWAATNRGMVKTTEKAIWNGYTGLKAGHAANVLGGVGAAGYLGYSAIKTTSAPITGQVEYEGQAPIMTADGMGTSKAPSLGANGSLVFGLNAMRRGR